jgi:hypothetical protein
MKKKKKSKQSEFESPKRTEQFPSSHFTKDQRSDAEKGLNDSDRIGDAEGYEKRSD